MLGNEEKNGKELRRQNTVRSSKGSWVH